MNFIIGSLHPMIYLLWFIGLFLISSVSLFILFVTVVKLQNFVEGKAKWVRNITLLGWSPLIVLGVLRDVLFQYTWGSLIFLEWPPKGERMLTWRLQRHKRNGYKVSGWRFTLAIWICTLIEKIEANHCHA